MNTSTRMEKILWSKGYIVAGVDEAGRGSLAGPVVAASVILPENYIPQGINDSKKLSPEQRESLFKAITEKALWAVGLVEAQDIDKNNILKATLQAMTKAVNCLPAKPDWVLVDGNKPIPGFRCRAIIGGDRKVASIAAASIIAKVLRDRLMEQLDAIYPVYHFRENKGYGTKKHIEAIKHYGLSDVHRKSFASQFCNQQTQFKF